jgi:hypothetical protein
MKRAWLFWTIFSVFGALLIARGWSGGNTVPAAAAPGAFAVTSVIAGVNPTTYNGGCPKTFNFSAVINVSGPGTVTYKWERSDGATSASKTIAFSTASSQTVASSWTLGLPSYSGWQRVHVLAPNDVTSNNAPFTLTCVPFAVTSISASVDPPVYTGPCPTTFKFTGIITANGPGTVTYRWEHSPGTGKVETVTFDAAGSKTVTKDYSSSMSDYLALIIDKPNTNYNAKPLYALKDFKCTCVSKID